MHSFCWTHEPLYGHAFVMDYHFLMQWLKICLWCSSQITYLCLCFSCAIVLFFFRVLNVNEVYATHYFWWYGTFHNNIWSTPPLIWSTNEHRWGDWCDMLPEQELMSWYFWMDRPIMPIGPSRPQLNAELDQPWGPKLRFGPFPSLFLMVSPSSLYRCQFYSGTFCISLQLCYTHSSNWFSFFVATGNIHVLRPCPYT
jgi:hypothetical protein